LTYIYKNQIIASLIWLLAVSIKHEELLEYEHGLIAINSKFDKLITSLRTAINIDDGKLFGILLGTKNKKTSANLLKSKFKKE
jgi:hypothetical protein